MNLSQVWTKYFIIIINVTIQKAIIMQQPSHDSGLGVSHRAFVGLSENSQRLKLVMCSDPYYH